MKNVICLLLFEILFTSCDEEINYDFVINNQCEQEIHITLESIDKEKIISLVPPNTIDTIYRYKDFAYLLRYDLSELFISFQIKKDTTVSKINYLSNDIWEYSKVSDTYAVYYLEVDSTHFE